MHSEIYQVGFTPFEEDDYVSSECFYEDYESFADYIGDEYKGEDRMKLIQDLAERTQEIFSFDRENGCLVRKSDASLNKFCGDWIARIKEATDKIDASSITDLLPRYQLETVLKRTHLGLYARFCIDCHCGGGWAAPFSDLVDLAVNEMKEGDKLYIGGVVDFHC